MARRGGREAVALDPPPNGGAFSSPLDGAEGAAGARTPNRLITILSARHGEKSSGSLFERERERERERESSGGGGRRRLGFGWGSAVRRRAVAWTPVTNKPTNKRE
jgi:hypothetical protein